MDHDLLRGPLSEWIDFGKKKMFLIQDCWSKKQEESVSSPDSGLARSYWQAMLASPARDPILAHVISFIIQNVHRHYYAEDQTDQRDLAITGPRLWAWRLRRMK